MAALLAVELDNELLLQRNVDLRALGQLVHEHPQPTWNDLQPSRNRPVALSLAGDQERCRLERLRLDVDDVVRRDAEARDVDLLAVDQEVAVADELASGATRAGNACAIHDVVQARLEDLQQVVAGLALALGGLLVVAAELLLQHAVAVLGLLLLLHLQQVLALLDARATVLARRVRATLEGLVAADQVDIEATRNSRGGSGVAGHYL